MKRRCLKTNYLALAAKSLKRALLIVLLLILTHVLTTTELSIILTSCLTAIKNHVINYCETVFERNGKGLFWPIKNSGEILKLKSKVYLASGLSTYDFSTLYTTLPHNLIKEKVTELTEQTFNRQCSLYLACNEKRAHFFYF